MYIHQRSIAAIGVPANLVLGKRPAEQPLGILCDHVDTAMTHRCAKVLVPVGAMEGMPLGSEEKCPWNARQLVIIGIGKQVAVAHMLGRILFHNTEFTLGRFCGQTVRTPLAAWDS